MTTMNYSTHNSPSSSDSDDERVPPAQQSAPNPRFPQHPSFGYGNTSSPAHQQPSFSGGRSYYAYQQFQAQRGGGQPQWGQNQNQWPPTQKPDPDAYVPQGAVNFSQSQTANWVNGPMYGSSAALPSYHGSAAPSVITNMSYRTNGLETDDNMSLASYSQFSSVSSLAAPEKSAEKDPEEIASELLGFLKDSDRDVRRRALTLFFRFITGNAGRHLNRTHCLAGINELLKRELVESILEHVKTNLKNLSTLKPENQERARIEWEQQYLFLILHYLIIRHAFTRVFFQQIEGSRGAAFHLVIHAIPNFPPQHRNLPSPLQTEMIQFLNALFLIIRLVMKPPSDSANEGAIRQFGLKICRVPPIVERISRVLGILGGQNALGERVQKACGRLRRNVILCLHEVLRSGGTDCLRTAFTEGIVENLMRSLDLKDATSSQAVVEALSVVFKEANRRFAEPEKFEILDQIYRDFLVNDGLRKISCLVNSVSMQISEKALLCLCYTSSHSSLRNYDLSEPVDRLFDHLKNVAQRRADLKVDPNGTSEERLRKLSNYTLSVFAMLSKHPSVRIKLAYLRISSFCLQCLEMSRMMHSNSDSVESALIIMNNLLNEKNPQVTLVRDQIIQAPAGSRVLLDQLVAGEFANKKRAMNILCRLKTGSSESLGDSFCAAKSSDGRHDFATALVNLIGQFFDPCRHPCECPCRDYVDFLANAFQFLKTLALQSLVFLDHTVQRVRENNVIKHLCRCANPKVCQAIIDFATELGTRDYTLFSDLSSDHNFTMRLKQLQSIPELGRSAGELLSRIQNYSLNTDLASAMAGGHSYSSY
ncbi:hypothetical protein L596_017955 [Steinernema carpocapsae]|uniref:Uncharacterized protein n=1 Tax=Steinernema carpocapsae TaxID=34508 RepID=A0A4U5N3X5_STECR|nr:hypothetical protein L596_017955 [Steinernema carpocapsae]